MSRPINSATCLNAVPSPDRVLGNFYLFQNKGNDARLNYRNINYTIRIGVAVLRVSGVVPPDPQDL